ncbi:fused isobutyryl-CoA mutase/GTPase IcmF [Sandaracinus amylolyticus]|uniref:Fused isobutyryl-CoA mutase n=1 Tax=Sandaracinus amylolyticus TaxID=927083 RepID=A0A0F6SFW3_9BACT|nr:fused isobutyryl-CoA mutase/GTPase IcmF [Sandaracinus amylolyticus]AKF07644.1 B12 binding domain / kinase domain / Methylmalonyl-CoA mutase [Sandaracinus amylolyticus]
MSEAPHYRPQNPIRIVSAAALFDGHDAAINVMRRILQASGAEVIHLGHNRSVEEVATAAVQEDAQGVALTSYQGGHMEYLTYLRERLDALGAKHTRIYGGGGGVIVPAEIEELHRRGIDRIFSPEDGRNLGLQGMIDLVIRGCDFPSSEPLDQAPGWMPLARKLTLVENGRLDASALPQPSKRVPVVGLTGTGGAGKSSLTDELVRRFVQDDPNRRVAVLCIDPTKKKTGGALLGDRIRMNSLKNERVFMRSMATRGSGSEVSAQAKSALALLRASGAFDVIFVETAGIGQGDSAITELADLTLYVMTAEYGAPSQLEKIEMLDHADLVAINKFTRRGSEDALRDVRRQIQRSRGWFERKLESLPVFGTSAAHFHDAGVNALYAHLVAALNERFDAKLRTSYEAGPQRTTEASQAIIPAGRERYLSEIAEACREHHQWAREQSDVARDVEALARAVALVGGPKDEPDWAPYGEIASAPPRAQDLMAEHDRALARLDARCRALLAEWNGWSSNYQRPEFEYQVRGKTIRVANYRETLSELQLRKVALPRFRSAGDRLYWRLTENVPGEFPYTAGTFPFKRTGEDPTRMFAGEGPSERTNKRFHYLADGQPAARLSTAFDSITLYGEDPAIRPDIYGKIGESGVSIATVEEAEQLYAGFDLCDPSTSVSMTINGPAPTVLAFFFNTAIRQQCRRWLRENGRLAITKEQELQPDAKRGSSWAQVRSLLSDAEHAQLREKTFQQVRGTVQADILKEDQGQNTCIFSTEFALKAMGDVQQFFVDHAVRNFYSVSISGYHIAEAGANPIHQLAYTLANGFTYVEYYRSRGMDVNAFAPNLSFFFSNGMDPEYTVIGRVARRIWAVALKRLYGADARSQMLKYHIQTSGRSLHAMEIEFNDVRTTLQALLATYDNAQSLHTNAYDEAITTPTEQSVRRAMAIQLIINKEFGLVGCENATQGSFVVEELTDLVEEAVLQEFDRLTERGGVLGAMERQYQRGRIQDDSMKYERLKHSGELPIIGVNTFLPKNAAQASIPRDVQLSRASEDEKRGCIARLERFHADHASDSGGALERLKRAAVKGENLFAALLDATEHCSLGQITHALYDVGGEYRRNL